MPATEITHGSVKKISFAWTSDGDGDDSITTSAAYNGKLLWAVTIPDGDAAPTDNYDLTLTDGDGVDVLAGAGADRDTANTEYIAESALGCVAESFLTLTVANAGAAKQGTLHVYLR